MEEVVNIANEFPKHLFWDMDATKLSLKRDKAVIIPRALYATTLRTFDKDIQRLEKFYSSDEIISILRNTKERISNEVCKLVAERYNAEPFVRYKL